MKETGNLFEQARQASASALGLKPEGRNLRLQRRIETRERR